LRAWLNLRYTLPKRIEVFSEGLRRIGFDVRLGLPGEPVAGDVLVTWNRISAGDQAARRFEARGLPVLVAENAAWGNEFAGRQWYSLARNFHNTVGMFPMGDFSRWDDLRVLLRPWRDFGEEIVILPQRGIGPPEVAMPRGWELDAQRRCGGRIRRHPGRTPGIALEVDLDAAHRVMTWGSGAAIKALLWGFPVVSEMPGWIGEQDNTDAGRLAMFRRLAWAQWTLDEIASGEPFARLLA
jgi:hypothetical protein